MGLDFTWQTNATDSILLVDPKTSLEEIGTYLINFKVCFENYPTVCTIFYSSFEVTACEVSSFTMNRLGVAQDRTYTLGKPVLSWSLETSSITV